MSQLSIDFEAVPPPRARRRDPDTSHTAAATAKDLQRDHHAKILDALGRFGPGGCSRIAKLTGLSSHQCNKRTVELERVGLLAWEGKEPSAAGRPERVWHLVRAKAAWSVTA